MSTVRRALIIMSTPSLALLTTMMLMMMLMLTACRCSDGEGVSFSRDITTTLDSCSRCQQLLLQSNNMISSRDTKEVLYESVRALCGRLTAAQASECSQQLNVYIRKMVQRAPKPKETCEVFGLCAAHKKEEQKGLPLTSLEATPSSTSDWPTDMKGVLSPVCTLCVLLIRKLETLLPKNATEETLEKLLSEVCELLPHSYREQCDDLVDKYGVEIIEFLLSSAAPHTICMLLHLCLFNKPSAPESLRPADLLHVSMPSECDSCHTLAVLSRLYLGFNVSQSQTSAFLQSVCHTHPLAIPKCELFTSVFGPQLHTALTNQRDEPRVCEGAGLCAAPGQLQPPRRHRCSRGPSYWCRNMETAHECGNQAFCERHVWKNE